MLESTAISFYVYDTLNNRIVGHLSGSSFEELYELFESKYDPKRFDLTNDLPEIMIASYDEYGI